MFDKEKLEDFKFDLWYYFIDKPRSIYYSIRRLVLNLPSWVPLLSKLGNWDYGYVLEVELLQLKKLRDGMNERNNFVGCEEEIRWMDIAIKLLKEAIDEYNPSKPYVNVRNYKRFLPKPLKDQELFNMVLREEKVWNLYNEVIKWRMRRWWD